jgi:glutamate synthase domain-containing protein 1
MKKREAFTLEDMAHFIIFRELDKLRVPFPYEKATRIGRELRAAVEYRSTNRTKVDKPKHK